jgi:hypothetical protein
MTPKVHVHPREKPHASSSDSQQQGDVRPPHDAVNSGDAELISKAIDDVFDRACRRPASPSPTTRSSSSASSTAKSLRPAGRRRPSQMKQLGMIDA